MINPSELVLNKNGSIYHLNLLPEQLASKVILVGDPQRVGLISAHFETIECKVSNREFIIHTGIFNGQRLSVVATGIGTDNIDIVLNELDALVNIDLKKREVKKKITPLELVRIGTCGSIQKNILADEVIVSTHAIGLDGLMHFYEQKVTEQEEELLNAFLSQTKWSTEMNRPYLRAGSEKLIDKIGKGFHQGITLTANGFYAPQGRSIRMKVKDTNQNNSLLQFNYQGHKVLNYEMETSALYGLSKIMGHQACTVCLVVANRRANSFSKNYHPHMERLIVTVLNRLTS